MKPSSVSRMSLWLTVAGSFIAGIAIIRSSISFFTILSNRYMVKKSCIFIFSVIPIVTFRRVFFAYSFNAVEMTRHCASFLWTISFTTEFSLRFLDVFSEKKLFQDQKQPIMGSGIFPKRFLDALRYFCFFWLWDWELLRKKSISIEMLCAFWDFKRSRAINFSNFWKRKFSIWARSFP